MQRNEAPERRLPSEATNLKMVIPGTRHTVAFEQPLRRADVATIPELRFFAFSRAAGASGESGRLDHMLTIQPESGVLSYQLLEGGLCLVTGDKRLINLYAYFTQVKLPNIQFPNRRFYTTNDPVLTPELLDYFFNVRTKTFDNLSDRSEPGLRHSCLEPDGPDDLLVASAPVDARADAAGLLDGR